MRLGGVEGMVRRTWRLDGEEVKAWRDWRKDWRRVFLGEEGISEKWNGLSQPQLSALDVSLRSSTVVLLSQRLRAWSKWSTI